MSHELLTNDQMSRADHRAAEAGVQSTALMEQAGQAVARAIEQRYDKTRTLVLCGPGNNGGDGFVVARLLQARGWAVDVAASVPLVKYKGDAKLNAARWEGAVQDLMTPSLQSYGLIIDALFGAGLTRPLDGIHEQCVNALSKTKVPVVAVDMPSGACGSTGKLMPTAARAEMTVTFCRKKQGHLLYPARDYCGDVVLASIDISDEIIASLGVKVFENDPALWAHHFPPLPVSTHKYERGLAVILSGPPSQTGAARLCARACLRAGAGIVKLAAPRASVMVLACHETEIMIAPCADADMFADLLGDTRTGALCIGPGMGLGPSCLSWLQAALQASLPKVLDADALTLLAENDLCHPAEVKGAVLTPHEGEFAKLFPGVLEQAESRVAAACLAAKTSGGIIVLKGPDSVIAEPEGRVAINATGTPYLATAGSGDVLAGIITSYLAQGVPAFEAACAGVYQHGRAGERAGKNLIASDLIEQI